MQKGKKNKNKKHSILPTWLTLPTLTVDQSF